MSGDLPDPCSGSQVNDNAQEVLQQARTFHSDTLRTDLEKVKQIELETEVARLTEEARNRLRENGRKLEEKFQAEFCAQTKLVTLYKSQIEEKSTKVDNLNTIVNDLQNLLKDQNRNMLDEIQNMGKRMSEATNFLNESPVKLDSSSKSLLAANIKYLREEKDCLKDELNLSQAKVARLESQLDNIKQDYDDVKKELNEKNEAATNNEEKTKEISILKRENVLLKNSQTNLQKESLALKKKVEDLSKSHTVEMAKLKKEIDVNKADGGDAVNNLKKELEEAKAATAAKDEEQKALKESVEAKEAEIKKLKDNSAQLRKIGSSFRTKFNVEEAKVKELTAEKMKLDEDIAKLKSAEGPSKGPSSGGIDEFGDPRKLLEQSHNRIADLKTETEKLKKEKEELAKESAEKEAQAKSVLSKAKERITKAETENKELKEQMENLSSTAPKFIPIVSSTLKRTRDAATAGTEKISGGEKEDGPSGQQKKAKSDG